MWIKTKATSTPTKIPPSQSNINGLREKTFKGLVNKNVRITQQKKLTARQLRNHNSGKKNQIANLCRVNTSPLGGFLGRICPNQIPINKNKPAPVSKVANL
jgi:hypothetical protein